MYSKNTKVYNKYKNENFSPSFGSFFNDNSSIDSVISYEDYNENIIEIQPLNIDQPVQAQNINLYENNLSDIENNYEEESNISSISNESIESGLMEFYYISKNYYFSFFFILLIWILYFTINNESLMFYTTTLYPDCKDVRNQVWRLITNCLVHSNLNHILVNSFFLLPFLIINEMMIDKKYLLPILLISIINCNLFFYYSNPYKALLGASGIIFCLSSIILSNMILNYESFINIHKISIIFLNIFIFFVEIISYVSSKSDTTSYSSHWFSYLSGFILSNSILPIKTLNSTKIFYKSFNIIIYLFGTIFLINNYNDWPKYRSYNELFQEQNINNCCYEMFVFLKSNQSNKENDFICSYNT